MQSDSEADVIRVDAQLRGSCIPASFTGTVAGVFDHAVNISVDGDPLIISIVTRRAGMSARSVLVARLPRGLVPGLRVAGYDEMVALGRPESTFEVGLGSAGVYDGRPAKLEGGIGGLYTHVVPRVRASVRRAGGRGGLAGLLPGLEADVFTRRAAALLERGEPAELVGLGGGLTPSGDDFLTGALAVEQLIGSRESAIDRQAVLRRVQEPEGTTDVSRTQLLLALRGRFPEYLLQVISAAAEVVSTLRLSDKGGAQSLHESLRELSRVADDAGAYGHSSGADTLTGSLWRLGGLSLKPAQLFFA